MVALCRRFAGLGSPTPDTTLSPEARIFGACQRLLTLRCHEAADTLGIHQQPKRIIMTIQELSTTLVRLCNEGKDEEAIARFYAPDVISIEAAEDSPEMPARIQGLEAVQGKAQWWHANHEVHSLQAHGPYHGKAADQFAVRFSMDVTPLNGERMQMDEVALYRVANGKIVEEQFLYGL